MASLSSFWLAVAMAALLVVGSCATEVTFKVGEGSSGKSLELVTNVAISEVEIKEKGGKDWVALKESSTNTWSLKSEAALKGPFSVRFLVKNGGYRVVDDVIPESFTAGSEYKSVVMDRMEAKPALRGAKLSFISYEVTFKVGEASSGKSLELVTNVAISKVEIKEKGSKDWVALKESSTNTWTIKSEAPLKGPFSIRFLVKNGGYRVVDDVIPESFTAGSEYKSGINI
uniref:Expansin-like CBD domain-containing protein n=1 Tax=Oryza glaberrima TaxID=4538 RepID=I1Q4C9_ORYGL